MNFRRYEFSNNSKAEFEEFKQIARTARKNETNCRSEGLWNLLLPVKNESNLSNLEEYQQYDNKSVLEYDNTITKIPPNDTVSEVFSCSSEVEDLTDVILENLEVEKTLSEEVLYKLSAECTESHLEQIFTKISNHDLDSETIYHFGVTISSFKGNRDMIIQKFFTHVLFKKLTQKSTLLEKLFVDITNTFCDVVVIEISRNIYGLPADNLKALSEYLNKLSFKSKNHFLRQFFCDHSQIQTEHLAMLNTIVSKETDLDILMKIVEVMVNVAGDCINDTTYGKLLVKLIECLGVNAVQAEQHLKMILNKHKSALRNKAKTILDNQLQLQQHSFMSQSFR